MFSLTDLIVPPLLAYVAAATLGILLALLRARGRNSGWIALDIIVLFPALIPVPVMASAFLFAMPGQNHLVPWLLAATFAAAPLAYLPTRIALARTANHYQDTARLLGLGPVGRFIRISLPLAWPAMGLGKLLAFTRIAGEWLLLIGAVDRVTILTVGIVVFSLLSAAAIAIALSRLSPVR